MDTQRKPYGPRFERLPWMSKFLLQENKEDMRRGFSEKSAKFLPLMNALLMYEEQMSLKKTFNLSETFFWHWITDSALPEGCPDQAMVAGRAFVLSVLMGYRVIETAHILYGLPSHTHQEYKSDMQAEDIADVAKYVGSFKKLLKSNDDHFDWVDFLKEAQVNAEIFWSKPDADEDEKSITKDSVAIRLLKSISRKTSLVHGCCSVVNIETAAAHLWYLINSGTLHIPPVSSLVETLKQHLGEDSAQCLTNLSKANFEQPLFLALAISPFLLITDSLMSKDKLCPKGQLLKTWLFSPLERSEAFIQAENNLWRAIFNIADGMATKTALKDFFGSLNFLELSAKATADNTRFIDLSNQIVIGKKQKDELLKPPPGLAMSEAEDHPGQVFSVDETSHYGTGEPIREMMVQGMEMQESALGASAVKKGKEREDFRPSQGKRMRGMSNVSVDDETNGQESLFSPSEIHHSQTVHHEDLENEGPSLNTMHSGHKSQAEMEFEYARSLSKSIMDQPKIMSPGPDSQQGNAEAGGSKAKNPEKIKRRNKAGLRKTTTKPNRHQPASSAGNGSEKDDAKIKSPAHLKANNGSEHILVPPTELEEVNIPEDKQKDWPDVEIRKESGNQRVQGQKTIIYPIPGLPGDTISYQPEAYLKNDISWFYQLEAQAAKIQDIPVYAANPAVSRISIISQKHWKRLTHVQRKELFSAKNLIIEDSSFVEETFNKDLLLTIAASMTRVVTVCDHSTDNFAKRCVAGTMDAIYHHSKDPKGLILNVPNLPSTAVFHPDKSISTDVIAFDATTNRQQCGKNEYQYPQRSVRWNDCYLKHANTGFHVSPNGFATYKRVISGAELLFFATLVEKPGISVGNIDMSWPANYNDELAPGTWVIEAIPILPGSIVYIRPCTAHATVAMRHTVSEGGYLYSWSTIKDTCFGILHGFAGSTFIAASDTENIWDSRELIRRMITYFHMHFVEGNSQSDLLHHIPDLTNFKDVVSLLCLLNVATLGHIIYSPFYQAGHTSFGNKNKSLFDLTREKAQDILHYLAKKVCFHKDNIGRVSFIPIFQTYFVQQVRCLIRQSRDIDKTSAKKLTQELAASFLSKRWFVGEIRRQQKICTPNTTYAWISKEEFVSSVCDNPSEGVLEDKQLLDLQFPSNPIYDEKNKKMGQLFDILQF